MAQAVEGLPNEALSSVPPQKKKTNKKTQWTIVCEMKNTLDINDRRKDW
jgi:hypothetical protein